MNAPVTNAPANGGQPSRSAYDVIVIGAGPAGMAAATVAAKAGLSTLIIDENPVPGGQVYRAATTSPLARSGILGPDFDHGAKLVGELAASGAETLQGGIVWTLDRELMVGVSRGGSSRLLKAGRVILATGALERPFPIPGWTLPGVMSVGAAQTVLKSSGLVPKGRIALAGQGPLLWLLAAQILRAGGQIEAILDTNTRANYLAALPHALGFLTSAYAFKGLGLIREVKKKVRVVKGVTKLQAHGQGALSQVTFEAGGRKQTLALDGLFLHQGVVPHVNLAMAAGVAHEWDDVQLCFRPVLREACTSSVEGILIAGDGAGIAGAEAAAERGRLAAITAAKALRPDLAGKLPAQADVEAALARASKGRLFLDILFRPQDEYRIPPDDNTIVCRCEEITAGQIRQSIAVGATGPNQLKAYRRSGMGPCQGRMCGLTVTELMAKERGKTPEEIGYYRLRAPVKPVTLAEIASIPQDDAAIASVVRG
jgi:thioredoxin reductase/bacterioferritin-associated ferredoxin